MCSLRTSLERMQPSSTWVGSTSLSTTSCWRSNGSKIRNSKTQVHNENNRNPIWQLTRKELVTVVERWVSISLASNLPSHKELRAHPWCRKQTQVASLRTPLSARCLRCRASTRRDSIRTHLSQEALAITTRTTARPTSFLNSNRMRKVSKGMPRISTVMGKPSILADTTFRSLTTKSSRWLDVWLVQKAATWKGSSRSAARTCLSRRKSSNWDLEARAQDSKKVQSKKNRKNLSIFASVHDSIHSTWQPATRLNNCFWTSTRSTRSTVRDRGVTSDQSTPVASCRSRSTRQWLDAGLRFSLFQTLIHKTRLLHLSSLIKDHLLRTTRCSPSTTIKLKTTTTTTLSLEWLEMPTLRTRCQCQQWLSQCHSTGQSCQWDLRMIHSNFTRATIPVVWTLCPSDPTKQVFHISKIKRQTPRLPTLPSRVAWEVCVWPTRPTSPSEHGSIQSLTN